MFKMIFFGVFLFFALIFALCGMLKGRKYKWQFSATRIILLAISTVIATLISALVGWFGGGLLVDILLPMLQGNIGSINIGELVASLPSSLAAIRALVAMIVAPLVFILVFNIVRPLINLLTRPIGNLLLKIGKKKPVEEAAPIENLETLDEAVTESEETPAEAAEDGAEAITESEAADEPEKKEKKEKKKKEKKYDRFRSDRKFDPLGAVLGAACSVLIFVVLLVPFVGIVGLANPVVQMIVTPEDPTTELVCEISDAAANNAGAKTVNALGGKAICSALTTFPVNGEWTSLTRETAFLAETVDAIIDIKDSEISRADAADSLRETSDSFDKAVVVPTILSDLLSAASEDWSADQPFCGVPVPKLGDTIDPVVKDFYTIMKDSDMENIRGDFRTIVDTIAIIVEHNAMDAMKGSDAMMGLFKNEPLVSGIMLEFLENDRMSSLVGSMTNLGLSIFSEQLGVEENTDGAYDAFVAEMTAAYASVDSSAGTVAAIEDLAAKVSKAYDNQGIALSNGVATCIALDMLDTLEQGDETEIKAFFKENGSSTLATEDGVEVTPLAGGASTPNSASLQIISSIAGQVTKETTRDELKALIAAEFANTSIEFTEEELEALSSSIAGKMHSDIKADKLSYKRGAISSNGDIENKTVKVTADDLKVEMTTIDDKEKEAKAIAKIFSSTLSTVDQLSAEGSKTSDVIAAFGPVLDNFASSQIIGEETTADILVSILQSGKVRDKIGFTLVQATDMANKINNGTMGDESYTVLLKSLGTTVDIISTASNKDGNTAESVEKLMHDITPTTAEVLKDLSTPDTVKNYGVPDKSADAVSGMMSDMFGNMSSAKEEGRLNEEEYARESQAVSDMMSIAMSAGKSDTSSTFGENSATNITATEFVDRATDSVVISETLVNTVYGDEEAAKVDPLASNRTLNDEEKGELVGALDAKWQTQLETSQDEAANAEYQKVLTSVASIVNVNIAFTAGGVVAG